MYTIAKCRNCGEIKPSNMIGELCPFCGETFTEEKSIIDYDKLIDNDNVFNQNLDLFYSNYIPFEKFYDTDSFFDYRCDTIYQFNHQKNLLNIIVLFEKGKNNKIRFNGVLLSLNKKDMYRIFINQSRNTENSNSEKEVEIKKISIRNLDVNLLTKSFTIPVNEGVIELPKLDKKNEKIYEKNIFNHLNITNTDKILEYISFNRVIYILRELGIPFAETKDSFLCNYNFFISHPSITDTTGPLSMYGNYSDNFVKLKNHVFYILNKNINLLSYIDSKNFEDSFIKTFLNGNKIKDYEEIFNYFVNKTIFDGFKCEHIGLITEILTDCCFNTQQYAIYKICKSLGYNTSLYFKFLSTEDKSEIKDVYLFSYIELEDGKIVLLLNDNGLKGTVFNKDIYGINVFPDKDSFEKFISFIIKTINLYTNHSELNTKEIEEKVKDVQDNYTVFEYKGDIIINKSNSSLSNFLLECINDSRINPVNIIRESKEEEIFQNKRKQITEKIYKVFSILDKTGLNTKKYQQLFEGMTDDEFKRYIKDFLKDEDKNFYLECLPNKNEPSLKQIKSALEYLKVPMDEYVYYRHDGNKNNPIRTRYKVPVGYIHIKRLQQMLQKKNTYSMSIDKRSLKTNQVTGDDKIA